MPVVPVIKAFRPLEGLWSSNLRCCLARTLFISFPVSESRATKPEQSRPRLGPGLLNSCSGCQFVTPGCQPGLPIRPQAEDGKEGHPRRGVLPRSASHRRAYLSFDEASQTTADWLIGDVSGTRGSSMTVKAANAAAIGCTDSVGTRRYGSGYAP